MVLGELIIRPLLKWLLGIEKEAEKKLKPEEFEEYLALKTQEEFYKRLEFAKEKALKEIEKLAEETKDPQIQYFAEEIKKWVRWGKSDYLMLLAVLEGFKQGVHKNPELFGAFLLHKVLEYYKAMWEVLKFPHAHPYPQDYLQPAELTNAARLLARNVFLNEEDREKAVEALEELEVSIPDYLRRKENWARNKEKMMEKLEELFWEIWNKRYKEKPEELFGVPEKEEEKIAPKIWAVALAERLPSASYRVASILQAHEAKIPLPTNFLEAYLHITTHHASPQGTALYNLVHHYLQELEQYIARGEKPEKPTTIIENILRRILSLKPYQDPLEVLEKIEKGKAQAEAKLLKARLGIPLKQRDAARALKLLYQHLRTLEKGEEDPHILDAKLELATLSKTIPKEPAEPDREWKDKRLRGSALRYIFRNAVDRFTQEAQQFGREEDISLLTKALNHAAELLDKADHSQPYYRVVGEIHKKVREKLGEEGHHPEDATWASNVIQHLLLTLPLHVVEKPKDVAIAKAILLEGIEPRKFDTAPLVRSLFEIQKRVSELPLEDAKSYLARRRDALNSLEALKGSISRVLEAHRQEGMVKPRELALTVHETLKSLSGTKPRIREVRRS